MAVSDIPAQILLPGYYKTSSHEHSEPNIHQLNITEYSEMNILF